MDALKSLEPRLLVIRENEHEIVVSDTEKPTSDESAARTYYKTRGRPLPLTVNSLTVHHQTALRWPPNMPLVEIPPLETVLSGKAKIWHYNGLQLMNDWSKRVYEVDIQLRVPRATERESEEQFAKEKSIPLPHGSFATVQFARSLEEGKEEEEYWLVDCWLPESIFHELYRAIMDGRLRSLTVAVSGENLYIDDWVDPAGKWTTWFLKSDRPDRGYSRGATCELAFVTGGFEKKTEQAVETAGPESSSAAPASETTYAQQIERMAMALESAQSALVRATSIIKWVVAALGAVALVLLLK